MTNKVQITLKNISTNERLSEETSCYSADLYVNGVKVGDVANRGNGGSDEVHIKADSGWTFTTLNDAVKASYGQREAFGVTMETDLELACADIVERHMELKSIKRRFKSCICVATDKDGAIREFRLGNKRSVTADDVTAFKRAKPDLAALVLNDMADDDLLLAVFPSRKKIVQIGVDSLQAAD